MQRPAAWYAHRLTEPRAELGRPRVVIDTDAANEIDDQFALAWALLAPERLALAADTASIAVMELVDNAVMGFVPGAMDAPLSSPLFWSALALALLVALLAAWPVNLWLLARGRGHALVHGHHAGH